MENIVPKIIEKITKELSGNPDARRNAIKSFSDIKEDKKESSDFLKNIDSISEIKKLISTKKLTNNQIKNKIKEFLNNPEELRDFLTSLLDEKRTNKKETKESTSTGGSSGSFTTKLNDNNLNTTNTNYKNIPTVREEDDNENNFVKKIETKEATGSGSSGSYSQPSIWAKSMKKKDFRGYDKPQYKGGKFVQIKNKCKKFPYCNQGDINALKIFENESVQMAIKNVSSKFNFKEEYISNIVFEQIRKTQI